MRNRMGGLLFFGVLTVPLASFAAPTLPEDGQALQNVEKLTAHALASTVLSRNAELQGLAAAAEAARYRIAPAGALDDPLLSYAGAPATAGGPRGLQERVELSQSLPWPGKLGLREDAARARAAVEEQSLADRSAGPDRGRQEASLPNGRICPPDPANQPRSPETAHRAAPRCRNPIRVGPGPATGCACRRKWRPPGSTPLSSAIGATGGKCGR